MRVLSQSEIDKLLSNLLVNPTILPDSTPIERKDNKGIDSNDNKQEVAKDNL